MAAITPVIDDTTFAGSDKGLALPLRRTSNASFALRISNLDHADPPAPYHAGGVPRSATFNANVLALGAAPKMSEIAVDCDVVGFDPNASRIIWRLQTLHVVGRFQKVSGGSTPHYKSRVLSVSDTWTGESSASRFVLFANDGNVSYDNKSDRVAGGHAILTVAAKPAGSNVWLQDYVHLRITGTNPTETIVRKYVRDALAQRNKNLEYMADAVFAWENAMEQFDPIVRTHTTYKGVRFNWPQDPAGFTSVAFDFGIGLGQFTHPGQETVGICWDWRDNLDAGINELLDDLRGTFAANQTFLAWAKKAWSMYNTGQPGASPYANRLANSDDGRKVEVVNPPANFALNAQTAHLTPRPGPAAARSWPVGTQVPLSAPSPHIEAATQAIVATVRDRVNDATLLAWMWPKIEREVAAHGGHDAPLAFPDLHSSGLAETLAHLDESGRRQATDAAFARLWTEALPASAKGNVKRGAQKRPGRKGVKKMKVLETALAGASAAPSLLATVPGGVSGEFNSLISIVRQNLDGGLGGWSNVRLRMFETFGADGNPGVAIPRINAYYGRLVQAGFPPAPSSTKGRDTPVHPVLKGALGHAATLLQNNGLAAALKFGGIGGFNIRNNANNANVLSNHSFGWAVDLDPALNPNIAKTRLPLLVIAGLTGLDLYGTVSEALRTPRSFDACLPDVTRFTEASAALVDAFRTMATLKAAAGVSITRATGRVLSAAQLDTVFAAGSQVAIRQALTNAGLAAPDAAAFSKWLFAAIELFPVKQQVTKPAITGNAGTVARFGFCNLPAALIAALIASDGGKLNWLGAARSTKDFMHFDLRSADQPKLVG